MFGSKNLISSQITQNLTGADTMTDTLCKELGRHLFHAGYENKNSEEIAEDAIAFIAAWALEPAQVERVARSSAGLDYGDASAAIGALFGEKT